MAPEDGKGNGGGGRVNPYYAVPPKVEYKKTDALVLKRGEKTYVVPLDVISSFETRADQNFDPDPDVPGFSASGIVQVTYQSPGDPFAAALLEMALIPCTHNIPWPPRPPRP